MKKIFIQSSLSFLLLFISSLTAYAQPPNALLTNAEEVTSSPFMHTVSVADSDGAEGGIYNETNENFCAGGGNAGFYLSNWWYRIEVGTAGTLTATVSVAGATDPPGNPEATNVCIFSDNDDVFPMTAELDGGGAFQDGTVTPSASVAATPGVYYISVGNSSAHVAPGDITATITFDGAIGAPPADVPTLSEWGLIILALLLMTFGTLYLIRENREKATFLFENE